MNPLYQMLMKNGGITNQQSVPAASGMRFQNPIQKMNYIMQAMQNPAAFVRQHIPGIPEQVLNDPTGNAVLQYMTQNMGVTQQDIQQAYNQIPRW